MSTSVHTSIASGIGRITIDRPGQRNALDRATVTALAAALEDCASDAAVRIVRITGAGAAFCAGADLKEMQARTASGEDAYAADARALADMLATLDSLPKPTLARINGDGYGGALGLIAACDIAVASEHAIFAFTEVRLGIIPAVISPFVLAKIGESAARRYFLTAETLTAERLRELGLVHQVVPAADLDRACEAFEQALLEGAPGAQTEAKRLVRDVSREACRDRAATAVEMGARLARLRVQGEAREGFDAFFHKRKPSWRLK